MIPSGDPIGREPVRRRSGTGTPAPTLDRYHGVALVLFLVTALLGWRGYVQIHEAIYLLGPHRVADPSFLARDLSWGTLPPTSFLYDHFLAPLWNRIGDFGIVSLGRILFWALMALALSRLARAVRLPPWSVVVGFAFWILAGQRLFRCGSPFEGFQAKSLSYPLFLFALGYAMERRAVVAGLCAGLATAIHVVVGGWGLFGVFGAMLLSRRHSWRERLAFLLAAAPFVAPLLIAVRAFQGPLTPGLDPGRIDEIYVTFAMPHCCDPSFFLTGPRLGFAVALFLVAPVLVYLWPRTPGERMPGHFVAMVVLLFGAGLVAHAFGLYGFLKLFPFQLASAIPGLLASIWMLGYLQEWRRTPWIGRGAWLVALVLAAVAWTEGEPVEKLIGASDGWSWRETSPNRTASYGNREVPVALYEWIRKHTPRSSVFVTPYLAEFWVCAERAQVASMRHPPFDRRILEWRERLQALNGSRPFDEVGFAVNDSLSAREARLSVPELSRMRLRYGATHYLTLERRPELADREVYSAEGHHVYDLAGLE